MCWKTKIFFIVFVVFIGSTIESAGVDFIMKCKNADRACNTKSGQIAWPIVAEGIPNLGIASSDPIHIKLIKSKDSGLDITFRDVSVSGIKTCAVVDVLIDRHKGNFNVEIFCEFLASGLYTVGGRILIFPVEGKGNFNINLKKLKIHLDGELNIKKDDNGNSFINIARFKSNTTALEPIVFNFDNLFNGNKELSDSVHTFLNMHYNDVLAEVGQPILDQIYKKAIRTVNKALGMLPIEEYFLS